MQLPIGYDDAISKLYEAVLDPTLWPAALAALSEIADCPHTGIFDIDYSTGVVWTTVLHNIDNDLNAVYLNRYAHMDVRLIALAERPTGRWHSDHEMLPDDVRRDHPLYSEYLRPLGTAETLCAMFAVEGNRKGSAGWVRLDTQGRATAYQRDVLDRMLAHIERAILLTRRLLTYDTAVQLGKRLMDATGEPVACVDVSGRILYSNRTFELAVEGHSAVRRTPSDGLEVLPQDAAVHFKAALADACRLSQGVATPLSGVSPLVPIPVPDGLPLVLSLSPLLPFAASGYVSSPAALVKITDPNEPPPVVLVQRTFNLTAAEARVACASYRGGLTKEELADQLGVTANTIKSQMKSVFEKLRIHDQGELVALMQAVPR